MSGDKPTPARERHDVLDAVRFSVGMRSDEAAEKGQGLSCKMQSRDYDGW